MTVTFGSVTPFDEHEQGVVSAVVAALEGTPDGALARASVQHSVTRLENLTNAVLEYPPELQPTTKDEATDKLESLLEVLSHTDLASFELFLPTRALLSRDLVMAEVNFYRSLRSFAADAPAEAQADVVPSPATARPTLVERVEACLCRSLYGRLALEVLTHIASDGRLPEETRVEAARSLWRLWNEPTYRLSAFFPALVATWDARRRVPVVMGTLLGTTELYHLIGAGCDPGFVDWLVRPDCPQAQADEQADAFREFLFGTTTEELRRIEQTMSTDGRTSISRAELSAAQQPYDVNRPGDPAIALFEFFLTRHLQAAARRRMSLPGPTRTAEEYVMLHFLEERRGAGS